MGSDFQAVVPHINTVLTKPAPSSLSENAVLVWSPVNDIPEEKCMSFFLKGFFYEFFVEHITIFFFMNSG